MSLSVEKIKSIKPGDNITFKSPTRDGCKKATRKVSKVLPDRTICVVQFNGWRNFQVMPHEVTDIFRG